MSSKRWVRSSLRSLSEQLQTVGYRCSPPVVGRLLEERNYSLRANVKSLEPNSCHPDRDRQFQYIAEKRKDFADRGEPVISVDTKKKELIGPFKNPGRLWCRSPVLVNGHDFRTQAIGRAVPYGIFDVGKNRGSVVVGASHDTPRFAVEAIALWWDREGHELYPQAKELLILCDCGGSNGCGPRMWKKLLQEEVVNKTGLKVTVCHYPSGCSKYNPVEHRLFSFISINWAGRVLDTFGTMLGCIRNTATRAGLKVRSYLNAKAYPLKEKASKKEMKSLNLEHHSVCPKWNYTISPQLAAAPT